MSGTQNRNARCHCGSGKKYKNCHGAGPAAGSGRKIPTVYIVAGLVLLVALGLMYLSKSGAGSGGNTQPDQPGAAPPGKVWSAEHNHWHDAP